MDNKDVKWMPHVARSNKQRGHNIQEPMIIVVDIHGCCNGYKVGKLSGHQTISLP